MTNLRRFFNHFSDRSHHLVDDRCLSVNIDWLLYWPRMSRTRCRVWVNRNLIIRCSRMIVVVLFDVECRGRIGGETSRRVDIQMGIRWIASNDRVDGKLETVGRWVGCFASCWRSRCLWNVLWWTRSRRWNFDVQSNFLLLISRCRRRGDWGCWGHFFKLFVSITIITFSVQVRKSRSLSLTSLSGEKTKGPTLELKTRSLV